MGSCEPPPTCAPARLQRPDADAYLAIPNGDATELPRACLRIASSVTNWQNPRPLQIDCATFSIGLGPAAPSGAAFARP